MYLYCYIGKGNKLISMHYKITRDNPLKFNLHIRERDDKDIINNEDKGNDDEDPKIQS